MTYSQFYAWLCNENFDKKVRKYFSKFWKILFKNSKRKVSKLTTTPLGNFLAYVPP